MIVVVFEIIIAIILSIEQVLVCRISLYSPPNAGYGTSCDEFCSRGDGIWMISSTFSGEKPNELIRVTKQQLDSQDLLFWLDGFQADRIALLRVPIPDGNSHCLLNFKIYFVGWVMTYKEFKNVSNPA